MPTLKERRVLCFPLAVAPAVTSPATRTVARVNTISFLDMNSLSLPFLRGQHSAQPLFECHFRLPAEHLLGARDVGLAHLGIVDREGFVHDLALRRGDADDGLGELE